MVIGTLRSHHDGRVVVNVASKYLGHVPTMGSSDVLADIYLYRPDRLPHAAFLIPDSSLVYEMFVIRDTWRFSLLSYAIEETNDKSKVRLKHPWYGGYVQARPLKDDEYSNLMLVDCAGGDFETFAICEVEHVSPHVTATVEKIDKAIGAFAGGLGAHLFAKDRGGPAEFEAVARTFPLDDFLACGVESSKAATSCLSHGARTVGTEYDYLFGLARDGDVPSATQLFNYYRRGSVDPTRKICVVATARNEGAYLLEWVAYHKNIGVEHFFIYTNDNTDESDDLLLAMSDLPYITVLFNHVSNAVTPQHKSYGHSLQILEDVLSFEWAAYIDIDEFIVLDEIRYQNIGQYLDWQNAQAVDSIALNWKMYGSDRAVGRPADTVIATYSRRQVGVNKHIKSINRPHRFIHSHCHFPIVPRINDAVYRDEAAGFKAASSFSERDICEHAWINHYYTKSLEDFFVRRTQNRGDQPVRTGFSLDRINDIVAREFLAHYDNADIPDPFDAKKIEKTGVTLASLRSLASIRRAEEKVLLRFDAEITHIRRLVAESVDFAVPGTPRYRLGRLLLGEDDPN